VFAFGVVGVAQLQATNKGNLVLAVGLGTFTLGRELCGSVLQSRNRTAVNISTSTTISI
jgi:hypothetical protein